MKHLFYFRLFTCLISRGHHLTVSLSIRALLSGAGSPLSGRLRPLCLLFALTLVCPLSLLSQENSYEITHRMPTFFEAMKGQLAYPLAWGRSDIRNFEAWKSRAREVVLDCLQLLPPPPGQWNLIIEATERRIPTNESSLTATERRELIIEATERRKGVESKEGETGRSYTAHRISFNLSAWSRVKGYLLVPEGEGPFPAVVLLHDHGAHFSIGKEKLVRPFGVSEAVAEDARQWVDKCYDGSFVGDSLAARGYVVLSVDALFWGDRGCEGGSQYDMQQALASNLMQMGSSWASVIHADDMRSAEFLASLPYVDRERIGCLGFSMGAYRSWMLSALSEVVKVSASICWMNDTDHLMTLNNNQNKGGSAFSMLVPGLRRYLDYPHVAAIACPKPALFFNGTRDKLFPIEGVEEAYSHLRSVWEEQGADGLLVTRLWDEKHFFNRAMQQEVFRFFDHFLQ